MEEKKRFILLGEIPVPGSRVYIRFFLFRSFQRAKLKSILWYTTALLFVREPNETFLLISTPRVSLFFREE